MSISNLKNHDFRSIRQTDLQRNYIRSSQAFFSACQLVKIATKQKHVFSENGSETSGKSGHGGDIENCNFKIVSQNVKGLKSDKVKRQTVFNYLKENGDIVFLQDTQKIFGKKNVNAKSFFHMEQANHAEL